MGFGDGLLLDGEDILLFVLELSLICEHVQGKIVGMEAFIGLGVVLVDELFVLGIDGHSVMILLDRVELTDDD